MSSSQNQLSVVMGSDPKFFEKARFIVGRDRVAIQTHKSILAISSPVLKAMLFGSSIDRQGPIELKEDCPEAFRALVEYAQSKRLIVQDFGVALRLCSMARKYKMPGLVDECLKYMIGNYEHEYGLEYYECLKEVGGGDCNKAMTLCMKHTEELLEANRHFNISIDTLTELYKQDSLNIPSEIILVNALVSYKEYKNDPALTEGIRTALSHVRLLTLDSLQILESDNIKKLLLPEDIEKIITKILSPQSAAGMPTNFTESSICRGTFWDDYRCVRADTDESTSIILDKYTLSSTTITSANPKANIRIKGVLLGTAVDQSVPDLDVVLTLHDQAGVQVDRARFRLKNLTSRGRKCMFNRLGTASRTFTLSAMVMNRVYLKGQHCGAALKPSMATIGYAAHSAIHSFLKGVFIK